MRASLTLTIPLEVSFKSLTPEGLAAQEQLMATTHAEDPALFGDAWESEIQWLRDFWKQQSDLQSALLSDPKALQVFLVYALNTRGLADLFKLLLPKDSEGNTPTLQDALQQALRPLEAAGVFSCPAPGTIAFDDLILDLAASVSIQPARCTLSAATVTEAPNSPSPALGPLIID